MLETLLLTLALSLGIQLVLFAFAAAFKTDKLTDLSYGLTFIVISVALGLREEGLGQILLLPLLFVVIWGVRLAGYLFMRILKIKRDKRFDGIREHPLKFAQFWLLQGVSVWIIMLPLIVYTEAVVAETEWQPLSLIGAVIWLVGLSFESVADQQKFAFKNDPASAGKWIDRGLWKYSRHPNYFGEMLVWWGLFIFVAPYLAGLELLAVVGPLYITFLLLFVTGVPTLEREYAKRYAGNAAYQQYVAKTPLLIPLPLK